MTARVLVVDDLVANVKLLEARLSAEYFEVVTAMSGPEALEICGREAVDVVLLDVMMPGMDGFEVCRRLKAAPRTCHLPVVMVTALDQTSDKVRGLEAGADDFLSKPVDEIALVTRVRNLARVKMLNDEMMMRAATRLRLGLDAEAGPDLEAAGLSGRVLLVDDREGAEGRMRSQLAAGHTLECEPDPGAALARLQSEPFDLLIVSLGLREADGLRLCSQVRSIDVIRHLPIIVLTERGEEARLMRGLDMGINDYLMRPIDKAEMNARVRSQLRRKCFSDFLRSRLEERVEQAVIDPLTGLHNRRYMDTHIKSQLSDALKRGKPFSVMLADIDYFKSVNDTFGHDVGDTVLKEFAARLRRNTRGIDLAARLGGEEFVVLMPDTPIDRAGQVAERLRNRIEVEPFRISLAGEEIWVTASVGVACFENESDTADSLLKRADLALYDAKRRGRNMVAIKAA